MSDFLFTLDPGTTAAAGEAADDGTYELNEQHIAEAINHLIELFRDGPRNQALLTAFGTQIQELENMLWTMYAAFSVDTATGDQLDILGRIVVEDRQGRLDSDYRAAVRVRILVNLSSGTLPELLDIMKKMVPTADARIYQIAPMNLHASFDVMTGTTLRTVVNILRQAKAGGVHLNVGYGGMIGAVDGSPAGGKIGAVDGNPAGFKIGGAA